MAYPVKLRYFMGVIIVAGMGLMATHIRFLYALNISDVLFLPTSWSNPASFTS